MACSRSAEVDHIFLMSLRSVLKAVEARRA